MNHHKKSYSVRRPWAAFMSGGLVGLLGGLIGLGGAEFRLPVLITVFSLFPHRAIRFNLLVSMVTLVFAALTRLQLPSGIDLSSYTDVVGSMIFGGMLAAWFGAGALSRISADKLMMIIAALLLFISGMLVTEAVSNTDTLLALPDEWSVRLATGLLSGMLVGAISSLLGVAGGEFIIPILIFIFGADIKTAGTLSLLISLPIVAIGVARHKMSGHYQSTDVLTHLVLPMSVGSIAGAVLGGYLSAFTPTNGLKIILAVILAGSVVKLWHHR